MKKIIIIICVFATQLSHGQFMPSDSIRFNRYVEDTDDFVSIPLTDLRYLEKTRIQNRSGWLSEFSFDPSDTISTFLVEMNTTDVPPGKWSDYAPGALQLAFEIDNKIEEVNLDTIELKLINHYATRGGTNDPTTLVKGVLKFKHVNNNNVLVEGTISIKTDKPITRQDLFLRNATLKKASFEGYVRKEKEKERIKKEQEEKMFNKMMDVYAIQNQFYDSIFSSNAYPNNSLWIKSKKFKKQEFRLNVGYVVDGSQISNEPSDNLMDLLGSSIYYPVDGSDLVFNLHYFDEGDSNVIDDETNYSFLFSLPELRLAEYDVAEKSITTNLSYWNYGPYGQVVDTKTSSGSILISEIGKNEVSGTLDLTFKMTDKRTVTIRGDFQLPIVDKSAFRELAERMKEETEKE